MAPVVVVGNLYRSERHTNISKKSIDICCMLVSYGGDWACFKIRLYDYFFCTPIAPINQYLIYEKNMDTTYLKH